MSIVERERVETPSRGVTVADVLERAADLLEEFGWCRSRAAQDASGECVVVTAATVDAFCLLGAYWRAGLDLDFDGFYEYGPNWAAFPLQVARDRLAKAGLDKDDYWNDAPGRTKAEVVQALRSAAEKAREA